MTGEMTFSFKDLYPNYKTQSEDTGEKSNADYEDQEALNEDLVVAEKMDNTNASRRNIFVAIIIMVALVILFGAK